MKKQLFILGIASAAALTGCNGIKKVEFSKFQEEVKAVEAPKVKEVKVSGKIDGRSVKATYEISDNIISQILDGASAAISGEYSDDQKTAIAAALTNKSPAGYATVENSKYTYYTGMGFKVKTEDGSVEWNGKGLLASLKGEKNSLKVSWVKA